MIKRRKIAVLMLIPFFTSIIVTATNHIFSLESHSSEIRGLRSTLCPRETLQNLSYFMYKKTPVVFFVFHFVQLYIFTL